MAEGFKNMNMVIGFTVILLVASMAFERSMADNHVVGDKDGWSNPRYPEFYAEWASLHTFKVGDSLYFDFPQQTHDVAEVPQQAYDECHTKGASVIIKTGPRTVNLTTSGQHHYISTVNNDCELHQKVAIYVYP